MAMQAGVITVKLLFAQDLKDGDLFGKQDPYCKLCIGTQKLRSKTHKNGGKNPVWHETFKFNVINENTLSLEIYDEDMLKDDHIGSCTVSLAGVRSKGSDVVTVPVMRKSGKQKGSVKLELFFESNDPACKPGATPASMPTTAPAPAPAPAPAAANPGKPSSSSHPAPMPAAAAAAPAPGYPPAAAPGYPPAGYPPAGYPPAPGYGYPPAAHGGGYPPAGYPQQHAGYPPAPAGYPPTGYPPAGYPPAPYAVSGYPPAGYPQHQHHGHGSHKGHKHGYHGYHASGHQYHHHKPHGHHHGRMGGAEVAMGALGGLAAGLFIADMADGDLFDAGF